MTSDLKPDSEPYVVDNNTKKTRNRYALNAKEICLLAMLKSETGRVSTSECYRFFQTHFPDFIENKSGWKSTIRSTLSTTSTNGTGWFVNVGKCRNDEISSTSTKKTRAPRVAMQYTLNNATRLNRNVYKNVLTKLIKRLF